MVYTIGDFLFDVIFCVYFSEMGMLVFCKRKWVLAICGSVLLAMYLCNVWLNIHGFWTDQSSDRKSCSRFNVVKPMHNGFKEEAFLDYQLLMEARRKEIQSQCNFVKSSKNKHNLFIVPQQMLMYCGLHSSDIDKLFLSEFAPISLTEFSHFDIPLHCFSLNFTTALYIQHPVERLMSLYSDKKMLDYYFSSLRKSKSKGWSRSNVSVLFPTFQRFINNFLSKESFALESLFQNCHPCDINYDVFIKPESFFEDVKYLFKLLGLKLNEAALDAFKLHKQEMAEKVTAFFTDISSKDALEKL